MRPSMRRHKRHKLKAEINVVPYIDVMLVLLIIFMVTAPLLHLGVDIKLPQAAAKSLQDEKQPVLVSLDKDGNMYLTLGAEKREPVDAQTLVTKVSAFVRNNPNVSVMFGGDERVDYGKIMQAMVLLQQAGVPNIGLMTQPPAAPDAPHGRR
ncbi:MULTISPECIES: protein TolR [Oleiagrimonas]|jgi:biopolymer transport protein TolR|uniref:Tol-Pal system protein TolR n=1 Tax=Oleiagrimonas citrea TaxID=1665687 RepID=A0A846ZNV4_9GAMM|nr:MULTISPECIES: protein TolR [Oleiagrimonas]NKZ39572.1 protein TolR [Oleiagrimonas citrea]RAP59469.1 protein TolR [Oleiagrimonas sp. MCCC 1A03011]